MGTAAFRMARRGEIGARTVLDITLADLSAKDPAVLRASYL